MGTPSTENIIQRSLRVRESRCQDCGHFYVAELPDPGVDLWCPRCAYKTIIDLQNKLSEALAKKAK